MLQGRRETKSGIACRTKSTLRVDDIAAFAATISSLRSDLGGMDVDDGEGEGHVS